MDFLVADCSRSQWPALREFFARMYGPSYVLLANEALFDWQFGPRDGSRDRGDGRLDHYTIKVAVLGGEIVGCLGYIPTTVKVADAVVPSAWLVNWMVDSSRRHAGVGPLLMREVMRQFTVILNVGANEAARSILIRMGWTDLGGLRRYVYVIDPDKAATLAGTPTLVWPDREPSLRPRRVAQVARIHRFGDDVAGLWNAVSGPAGAGALRDDSFLNWRYAQHPTFTYRLFEAREGRLKGVAVYRVEPVRGMPITVGRITEFFCEPDVEQDLFAALVDDARAHDVSIVDFFCSSASTSPVMARGGFVTGDELAASGLPRLFQPLDRRHTDVGCLVRTSGVPSAPLDWYITTGDGDQDRPN